MIDTENGNIYAIVTELMAKGDLETILHKHPEIELPLTRQLGFAIDIASGMAWLAGRDPQILHRDLKPSNVLVDENWRCKIGKLCSE